MMRDENRVKKCEKYLILLNKLAGVVQWQNGSFPSCTRGCMGRQDEVDPHVIDGLTLMRAFVKIANAADRRKVIELAAALARPASPPIAPT